MKGSNILFVLFSVLYYTQNSGVKCHDGYVTMVLLFDSLHQSYLNRGNTPNLDYIARTGGSASYMKPAMPSSTLPSTFTAVTGYTENQFIIFAQFSRLAYTQLILSTDSIRL